MSCTAVVLPRKHRIKTPATSEKSAPFSFFNLPPELRILIYEQVFSAIQDHVNIRVFGGENASKWYQRKIKLRRKLGLAPSKLALLLTCRKINSEASPIAYSNMSMVIEARAPFMSGEYMLRVCDKLLEVFGYEKLHRIPHVQIKGQEVLDDLPSCDLSLTMKARDVLGIEAFCKLRSTLRLHPVQDLFCNVTRMTVLEYEMDEDDQEELEEGASWLSTTVRPGLHQEFLLEVFPNLREILVQRDEAFGGGEQKSVVFEKGIYAADAMGQT